MGCSESKENKISVENAKEKLDEAVSKLEKTHSASSSKSSGMGSSSSTSSIKNQAKIKSSDSDKEGDTMGDLPSKDILDNIPNSDLGVSTTIYWYHYKLPRNPFKCPL